jgi:Zn-dependent M28 family amino/carboxypeptidase
MNTMPRLADPVATVPDVAGLRETVEALAAIEHRGPCTPGEREAAEWLARRFGELGTAATIEEERAFASYAGPLLPLLFAGLLAAAAALSGRSRWRAALVAAAGALGIAEDVSNGPRVFRGLVARRQPTWNVVACSGDAAAERTIVVLAHHDAAPTGFFFDQTAQRTLARRFPELVERIDTSAPVWWPVVGGPALVAAGAALRSRRVLMAGTALTAFSAVGGADIARNRIVPGANDNLSAVAVLVALAQALRERPVDDLRVLLVSCGSEETLQGGIHGFVGRHATELDPKKTWFLNLDTVGAPRLVMLEGEGPFVMEDYNDPGFRDFVAGVANRAGVTLRRGMRSRASTDSVVPSRAGYPVATFAAVDYEKAIPNYHQLTDTPENLDYNGVAQAAVLADAVIRELAAAAR